MREVNPSDALGEEELQAIQTPEQAAEGASGFTAQAPDWLQPFLNTDPRISIGEIQGEHDCSRGEAHLIRAGMKGAGVDGIPMLVDLAWGLFLVSREGSPSQARETPQTEREESPPEPEGVGIGLTEEELETGTRIT